MTNADITTKSLLVSLLYMGLFIDYVNDTNQHLNIDQFLGSLNSIDEIKTNRQKMINLLNNNRYNEGRFFVPCKCCDRRYNSINESKICPSQKYYPIDETNSHNMPVSYCNKSYNKSYNKSNHDGGMSFYNSKYVDNTKTNYHDYHINDKNKYDDPVLSDYVFWPSLYDPINGQPYV